MPNQGTLALMCPLPLTLTHFSATYLLCKWTVETEEKISHYVVERIQASILENPTVGENLLRWQEVGRVNAIHTNRTYTYSVIDNEPLMEPAYYRLRVYDYGGNIYVKPTLIAPYALLTPNPARDHAMLHIVLEKIFLTDLMGKRMLSEIRELPEGSSVIPLPLDHLKEGIYSVWLCRLDGGGEVLYKNLLIVARH